MNHSLYTDTATNLGTETNPEVNIDTKKAPVQTLTKTLLIYTIHTYTKTDTIIGTNTGTNKDTNTDSESSLKNSNLTFP